MDMGYDIERFVGYVNEGLLCSICRDVLEDPLQAPCEHAFCTACIHGWLRFKNSYSFVHRYMKNDLNRLQLHCKNREYGCEMVCSLESIDRHERECEYSQIPCSNAGCTIQVERRNLDVHLAVCEYRSRECPNGCGYTILSAEDTQHNCVAELRTELELLRYKSSVSLLFMLLFLSMMFQLGFLVLCVCFPHSFLSFIFPPCLVFLTVVKSDIWLPTQTRLL
uniref:E3 ubiquitin-protein ligase NRDP1 n=1 Tax=Anas platyrhynchos TaxID=8839 RepID=A0A8B9SL15_ANAPL